MKKINQAELEILISDSVKVDKSQVALVLDGLMDVVAREIKDGNTVYLTGFGKFESFVRSERVGIDPRTLERIMLSNTKVAKFRAGSRLKNFLKK